MQLLHLKLLERLLAVDKGQSCKINFSRTSTITRSRLTAYVWEPSQGNTEVTGIQMFLQAFLGLMTQVKTNPTLLPASNCSFLTLIAVNDSIFHCTPDCSYYRIAGNFCWCKLSRKCHQRFQKKFSPFLFSRQVHPHAGPCHACA